LAILLKFQGPFMHMIKVIFILIIFDFRKASIIRRQGLTEAKQKKEKKKEKKEKKC